MSQLVERFQFLFFFLEISVQHFFDPSPRRNGIENYFELESKNRIIITKMQTIPNPLLWAWSSSEERAQGSISK